MHQIIIQEAAGKIYSPKKKLLRLWANSALKPKTQPVEVTMRIVTREEMTQLNEGYRRKKGATNVLSFPFSIPDGVDIDTPILGDIVLCAEIINQEAEEQHKTQDAHWAHMVIHSILHLQGYNHETKEEADIMEPLEIEILASLGFEDPYQDGEHIKDNE